MFLLALSLARTSLAFGQVNRATMHPNGTFESDTTHTVMLILIGIEMAKRCGFDAGLVAQFAAVHDLPEVYALDTNTAKGLTPAEAEAKAQREKDAIERLTVDFRGSATIDLLHRYEAQQEPEARLVRYLDKVLPKLTHILNRGAALRAMGITSSDVREKHAVQGAALAAQYPELAEVRQLFNDACEVVEMCIADGSVITA